MAHIEKFKKTEVSDLLIHNERKDDSHSHSNEDIDVTKSYLNYDLCTKEGTAYERFKKRLSEVKCLNRDDVNVIDSLIVHLPTDVKKGDEKKFFEGIYAFACQDYGEENIINANVHRDETREHIHLGFIPVVEKKRNGITEERVCHDKKITRNYYKNLHINLMKYMKNYLGYEVSILNGATAGGNKTIQQLKAETLKNKNEELEKHIEKLQEKKTTSEKEVQSLEEKSRDLKKEVEENQSEVEELQEKIMQYEPPKKNLMESNKSYEERSKTYQELQLIKEREISQQRLQAELTAREQAVHQREVECERKKKALEEELQQAYEKGYAVGYETGKERGRAEQPKEDKAKIAELERTIAYKNKILQEIDDDVISLGYENYEDMIADIQERQEQEEEIEYE